MTLARGAKPCPSSNGSIINIRLSFSQTTARQQLVPGWQFVVSEHVMIA